MRFFRVRDFIHWLGAMRVKWWRLTDEGVIETPVWDLKLGPIKDLLPPWRAERTVLAPVGPLCVQSVKLRFDTQGDYIVQVNDKNRKAVGRRAIIVDCRPEEITKDARAVLAQVRVNKTLNDNEICVDRTLQNALLLDEGRELSLFRVIGGYPHRRLLQWSFKPRKLWAYAYRSFERDQESNLCTVAPPTLNILGLQNNAEIRLEHVFWDREEVRFKVGIATPKVSALPEYDVDNTFAEILDEQKEQGYQHRPSIMREGTGEKLRLPFVRLDQDLRYLLAHENLKSWKRRIERGSENLPDLREVPTFAPVRLSASLPAEFFATSVLYLVNASIGVIGATIAGAEIHWLVGLIAGLVYVVVFLPLFIAWDIKRRVQR